MDKEKVKMEKQQAKAREKSEKAAKKAKEKAEKEAVKAAKKAGKGGGEGGNGQKMQFGEKKQTISLAELNHFGPEDRIAVMEMVKAGELTIEEAMYKVKSEAKQKDQMKDMPVKSKGDKRQGAVKKTNRGRVHLELKTVGTDTDLVVIHLKINKAYDLDALEADPFLKAQLRPDPNNPQKPDIKQTNVHHKTRNPIFNDDFQWTIKPKLIDLESVRVHIQCFDQQGGIIKRSQFMGSMSFSLAEVWDPESSTSGWFKLLDEKKGNFMNQKFVPKFKATKGGVNADVASRKPMPLPGQSKSPTKPQQVVSPSKAPSSQSVRPKQEKRHTVSKPKPVEVKVSAADFVYTKVLGRGSFGKVLLAEKKGCDEVFAIKVLKKTSVVEDDDVAGTLSEKRVLALSQGSPFLTKLHATFQTNDRLFFVMEFVNGGDLMYHIQLESKFSFTQSQFYAAEILLGLWYLHENGVVYRDLKLDNVMLERSGHIKIADFGMCKENMFGGAVTTTFCGTPGYLAPEIIKEMPYGASVDFWSLGVLCYEFLMGDSPFEAEEDDELFDQIQNAAVEYDPKLSPAAKAFVDALLDRNPKTRLGCGKNGKKELKGHAFFQGLDWDKLEKLEIEPPFKPSIKDPKKAECFDEEFTNEEAELTPIDEGLVATIEQSEFKGFSFTNPKGAFISGDGGDYVAPVNKNDLRVNVWYRPELGRPEVVSLLKGRESGAFCVRDSASQPGCYALSVSVSPKADKLWTGLITPTDDGRGGVKYRLFVKLKFDSVADLVEYYKINACITIDKGKREVMLKDVELPR